MKRFALFVTNLFLFLSAFGQIPVKLTGVVVDEHRTPLPYVNIGIVGTTVGTVSGPDGTYTLHLSENVAGGDTLRFSMVGHKSCSYSLADFTKGIQTGNRVTLPKAAFNLQEVVVRPRFSNKKLIGMMQKKTRRVTNFAISKKPNQNLGAEIGRKFRLPKGGVHLDTFYFYVAQNNFDTVRFRINIYEIKKGKPARNIAPQNIIVQLTEGQTGWVKVDLTPFQLMVNEKVAIAAEWIYHSATGRALAIPIAMPSAGVHFYKYGSQGKWKKFMGMSAAMRLQVSF
ncbi:MAG: carboxypeptidase-like regulatory domain-containing protein [Bacteroidota bacterium]